MKKEIFFAISIGFILGLIITFGIWTANKSLKPPAPSLPSSITTPTPTSSAANPATPTPEALKPEDGLTVKLTSPTDEALVTVNTVTVTGLTLPTAVIVITAENSQQIVTQDSSGSFSAAVKLEGGYNLITVTAVDPAGNRASTELTVTYTTAKI